MELNLIPRPQNVKWLEGTVFAAAPVRESLDEGLPREGYTLRIDDGISLRAGSKQGLVWGRQTLNQLKRQFPEELPRLEITDAPAYPLRSIHLDSARHMLPIDDLKKMADAASYFKLNTIHWHISDDQGWRVESKAFPGLHEIGAYRPGDHFGTCRKDEWEGGYYTREEVKNFVAYCDSLGIQVIPEVDMPGHVRAILAAYPHLSCRGEKQPVVNKSAITFELLCAGNEEVYDFVEKMLDDLLELFPAPWFHIGGDEAPKAHWETCPKCQAKMKEEGLTSLRQLQGYFSNRLAAHLRSRGRRALVWNDGAYGGNLDPDIVLHVWFPDRDGALQAHGNKGGQMLFAPVDICYCDYPHGEHPLMPIYNMEIAIPDIARDQILGVQTLHWSEHIRTPQRLYELAWPRGAAVAEAGWSGDNRAEYADFLDRLRNLFPVFGEMGICATDEAGWDPSPEEAEAQKKAFRLQFEDASDGELYEQQLAQM